MPRSGRKAHSLSIVLEQEMLKLAIAPPLSSSKSRTGRVEEHPRACPSRLQEFWGDIWICQGIQRRFQQTDDIGIANRNPSGRNIAVHGAVRMDVYRDISKAGLEESKKLVEDLVKMTYAMHPPSPAALALRQRLPGFLIEVKQSQLLAFGMGMIPRLGGPGEEEEEEEEEEEKEKKEGGEKEDEQEKEKTNKKKGCPYHFLDDDIFQMIGKNIS
jgi:hypothetical protein